MSKIFNLLPVGEEHAISLKALSAQTGLPERALRSQIVAELEDGSPCLSSCTPHGGYYRPSAGEKGLKEMQRFYQQERSRASSTFRKLKAIRRTLTQCAGQIELEPLEDDNPEDTEKDEQEDTYNVF